VELPGASANILPIIFKLLLSNPVWFCVKFYHSNRLVKAPAQYPHDAAFPRNQLANIFAVSFEILKRCIFYASPTSGLQGQALTSPFLPGTKFSRSPRSRRCLLPLHSCHFGELWYWRHSLLGLDLIFTDIFLVEILLVPQASLCSTLRRRCPSKVTLTGSSIICFSSSSHATLFQPLTPWAMTDSDEFRCCRPTRIPPR
jgi:hypothetical protein